MLFKKENDAIGLKWRLIGLLGKLFVDFLFVRSQIVLAGFEPIKNLVSSGRCIYAFWHSRILLLSYFHKNMGASILVSNSADGEIIAQILQRQGQHTVRGSTGKGGLRALTIQIRDIRLHNRPGGIVPDGPQGPRHKVQPGVILLAQKTGCPIIPVTYSAARGKIINSWDKFFVPMPWSPCLIHYGAPIQIPSSMESRHLPHYCLVLENELNRITARSDAYFGHNFDLLTN